MLNDIIRQKLLDPLESLENEMLRRAITDAGFREKYQRAKTFLIGIDPNSRRATLMFNILQCDSYEEILTKCNSWADPEVEQGPITEWISSLVFLPPLPETDEQLMAAHQNQTWPRTRAMLLRRAQEAYGRGEEGRAESLIGLASRLRNLKPEEILRDS